MRAGDLDRVISIERKMSETTAAGDVIDHWDEILTLRAKVTHEAGREFFQSGQTFSEARVLFLVRYHPNVRVTDRVVFEGQRYDVNNIREVGRRVGLELMTHRIA